MPIVFPQAITPNGLPVIAVALSVDVNNPNIYSLAGSPSVKSIIRITLGSGVKVGSTSTGTAALDLSSSSFPAGTEFEIDTSTGTIEGKGGAGGTGGTGGLNNAGNGGNGGDAIKFGAFVYRITNGSGFIFGGGGGGGGGGGNDNQVDKSTNVADGGGGGGGGAGNQVGPLGALGHAQFNGTNGTDGSPGTNLAGGAKGLGGHDTFGTFGGDGGDGGGPGADGSNGSPSWKGITGGTKGTAGKAINLNGGSVTWISGNDSTHVKGAVS